MTQVLEKLRVEEPLLEARIRGLQEQRATKQSAMQVGGEGAVGFAKMVRRRVAG
mgnify:CR=1 FL=1